MLSAGVRPFLRLRPGLATSGIVRRQQSALWLSRGAAPRPFHRPACLRQQAPQLPSFLEAYKKAGGWCLIFLCD